MLSLQSPSRKYFLDIGRKQVHNALYPALALTLATLLTPARFGLCAISCDLVGVDGCFERVCENAVTLKPQKEDLA